MSSALRTKAFWIIWSWYGALLSLCLSVCRSLRPSLCPCVLTSSKRKSRTKFKYDGHVFPVKYDYAWVFWPKRQIASAGAHSLSLSLYLSLSLSIHPASQPAMWVCVCVCYTACPPNTFRCVSNGICIPTCQLCDGYSQCDDNSDEYNCAHNNSKYACVDHFMQLRSMWRLAVCLLSCRNASCPMWYQIQITLCPGKK